MTALPYLTAELLGTGGVLRTVDDDFFVDESLPYAASGAGDHVFVRFQKRGMTTRFAVAAIAQALGCNERDIGVAGMKDRHAVTRQWISVPPPVTPEAVQALVLPDIEILEVMRHQHKLRTGHVRANHFRLRVRRATDASVDIARAILEVLATAPGTPNWYGEQRFGRDGGNVAKGRAMLAGERVRDRKLARLFISSLQSELFNQWLIARMADGLYREVIAGDLLHKMTGGMFASDDPHTDTARLRAGELVLTGPMFGVSMRAPPSGSPAAEREAAILAAAGLAPDAFVPVSKIAEGTRRDATILLADTSLRAGEREAWTYELAFALPSGAYATAVMRELMKDTARPDDVTSNDAAEADAPPDPA